MILLCAATSLEVKACENAVVRLGLGQSVHVLKTGMGMKKTGVTMDHTLARAKITGTLPKKIFIAGFSGAVDSALNCGDCVLISKVFELAEAGTTEFVAQLKSALGLNGFSGFKEANLLTSSRLIKTVNFEKSEAVAQETALCVDMESAVIVKFAEQYQIPVYVMRYITDSIAEPLPDFIHEFFSSPLRRGLKALAKQKGLMSELFLLQKKSKVWAKDLEDAVLKLLPAIQDQIPL